MSSRLTILYFDCFSGAAGDMILGALLDAGLPLDDLRRALGSLAIDPRRRLDRARHACGRRRHEIPRRAARQPPVDHAHDHARDTATRRPSTKRSRMPPVTTVGRAHHAHRTLAEIERLIDGSALVPGREGAREGAVRAARRRPKRRFTGRPIDKVHLHEVGALDSIIDIVGTVYALEALGVDRVVASPLNVGSGSVHSAHGLYPVPAPATTRLLEGVPIYSGPQKAELVTPTGALLVTATPSSFGGIPPMRLQRVGLRRRLA